MTTRLLPYGDRAWLVDCDGDPVALATALRRFPWPEAPEVVVGARTCLLRFHGAVAEADVVGRAVAAAAAEPRAPGPVAEPVVLPVRYDGPDLDAVARSAGMGVEEVIALHSSATYRVAFLGFAPGFGYLEGLPTALRLPRRASPRTRVPAGSVAIADRYTAVYPGATPGGWHLLGSCAVALFDPGRNPPSLLRPGLPVRFEPV